MPAPRALVERAAFTYFGTDGTIYVPLYVTYIAPDQLLVETKEVTLVTSTSETALVMNRQLTELAVANKPASIELAVQDVVLLLHISKGS